MTSKKDMCKVLLMACAIAIVNRSNANDGEYEYEFEHTEPHNSPHKSDVGLYPGNWKLFHLDNVNWIDSRLCLFRVY